MSILQDKWFDSYSKNSLAWRLRTRRFEVFRQWLQHFEPPLKILDVGGTMAFWKSMGFDQQENVKIVLLNLNAHPTDSPVFTSIAGDATDMSQLKDQEFDIVFSNSVIEHVGDDTQQERMASEVMRVGKAFFIQTPNIYFPVEAHFYFPYFQFMPVPMRAFLLYYFDITGGGIGRTIEAWKKRITFRRFDRLPHESWERCLERASSVRLLSQKKFQRLFPHSVLYKEKCFGLTKSFILHTPVSQDACYTMPFRMELEVS